MKLTCQKCGGLLEVKPFCPSCKGAGGWGNWLETGDDTCVNCGGAGEPQADDTPVMLGYCPKCRLIHPPIPGPIPSFLKIGTQLPTGGIHVMELDESSAREVLAEMEKWGDDCSPDSKAMREELRTRFNPEYQLRDLGDGSPVRVKKCPDCGVAPSNVDDCGHFGNPACPYFGIGKEEFERRQGGSTPAQEPPP